VAVETELPDESPALQDGASIALFRICEEALSNAAHHARAASIRISLREERGSVTLEIVDNGIGFELKPGGAVPASLGLLGMRERAAAIGGTLSIERGAGGRGTIVRVVLPAVGAEPSAS